jgi:hypothetical protein
MKSAHFVLIIYIIREEQTFRVFENGVLRRMYGPKREDLTVGCRKLHNEEFNLYPC